MALIRSTVLLGALALVAACAAETPRRGLYRAVTLSEETGDQSGAVLYVDDAGPEPRIRFNLCEGECREPQNVAARLDGGVATFEQNGRKLRAVFEKGGVTLTSPDAPDLNLFLPRVVETER